MSEPTTHALLSPSGASRWMACPGSIAMEAGQPNESSEFAREGTAAHSLAAMCLTEHLGAHAYVGRIITVEGQDFEVTPDMADHVQTYVDVVHQYATGHDLLVEQRVPIDHITGETGAEGTSDAIIVTADGSELIVIDLKFGRGVMVSADNNEQGQLYALGALELVTVLGYEPKHVRIVIHQPRVQAAPSEWDCSVDDLKQFAILAQTKAEWALACLDQGVDEAEDLNPGEKQCRFCKAKATCPALVTLVAETTGADFEDVTQKALPPRIGENHAFTLGAYLPKLDLIEEWCDAIRKRAHAELLAGNYIPGYKLVQGKKGARAWTSEIDAEALLKSMRLKHDQMYQYKVISPTTAEKLLAKDSPRRWSSLQKIITQGEGKPTVAPAADKRPAIEVKPTADEFQNETAADLV